MVSRSHTSKTGNNYHLLWMKCLPSAQMHIILEPPAIDGHAVIRTKHPFEYVLVDDMGGHGRALEALQELLATTHGYSSGLDYNIEFLLNGVVNKIQLLYPDLATKAIRLKPVIAAIISHTVLDHKTSFGSITVEDAISMGFLRYNQATQRLECPFFLIYLFALQSGDNMLAHLPMLHYNQLKGVDNAPTTRLFWETWEEFVGQFRMLKGYFYGGKEVLFSELHAGALMTNSAANMMVYVPPLNKLVGFPHICTPTQALDLLSREPTLCLRNAPTADAADGCCGLMLNDKMVLESHQYKHKKSAISVEKFEKEYNIGVSSSSDFFILFATNQASMDMNNPRLSRSALVCRAN